MPWQRLAIPLGIGSVGLVLGSAISLAAVGLFGSDEGPDPHGYGAISIWIGVLLILMLAGFGASGLRDWRRRHEGRPFVVYGLITFIVSGLSVVSLISIMVERPDARVLALALLLPATILTTVTAASVLCVLNSAPSDL